MHTIAVIEDDRMLNEALARMLQKNGYQVTRAHTLAEGRKLAALCMSIPLLACRRIRTGNA